MRNLFQEFLFLLLITGILCLYEYHESADAEYNSVNQEQPLLAYKSAKNTVLPQKITITRAGDAGLRFEVERSDTEAQFNFGNNIFVVSSFNFEFGPEEVHLRVQFDTAKPSFQSLEIEAKVFKSPESKQLEDHAEEHAISIIPPTTTDEIADLMDLYTPKEKSSWLTLDWVENLLTPAHPILSEENESPETLMYKCKPVLVDADVLEKLVELKEHMQA